MPTPATTKSWVAFFFSPSFATQSGDEAYRGCSALIASPQLSFCEKALPDTKNIEHTPMNKIFRILYFFIAYLLCNDLEKNQYRHFSIELKVRRKFYMKNGIYRKKLIENV